ncbi:hypothetical protein LCGC14_3050080, partial [marine sediment metagenome]
MGKIWSYLSQEEEEENLRQIEISNKFDIIQRQHCELHKNECNQCHHKYEADWRHGGGYMDGDFFSQCAYPREGKTKCSWDGTFYIDASEDCLICKAGLEHLFDRKKDEKLLRKLEEE